MESFIGSIVFILPGFFMYFWIQFMGVNPVMKHSTIEFGALSVVAWFPVSAITLGIMASHRQFINNLDELSKQSSNIGFLTEFVLISIVISFVLSAVYALYLYPKLLWLVNKVRLMNEKATLDKNSSLWEELFLNNNTKVYGIQKIGSDSIELIGNVIKTSRPFENKRGFNFSNIEYCTSIVFKHNVPIDSTFVDIDSGIYVHIYNYDEFKKAQEKQVELDMKEAAE